MKTGRPSHTVVVDVFDAVSVTRYLFLQYMVPASSSSHGRDVAVYVFDIIQPSLPTPYYSVLVSIIALSTVFHFIDSPDNSPLSHFVLPVLILPYWSFPQFIPS